MLSNLLDQMQEHLLEVYQSELKSLTIETRKKEYPMATIQFRTKNQCEGITRIESLRGLSDYGYSAEYISNRCYYPVYPSFTGTIALLKEAGVDFTELNTENVSGIQITSYPEGDGNRSSVHMMKEKFDACVSPSAMFCKKKNREPPNTPPPARHSSSFRLRAKKLWEEIGHTAT